MEDRKRTDVRPPSCRGSQSLTVPSRLVVAKARPSGENATHQTRSCPVAIASYPPVAKSQRWTMP